MSLVYSTGEVLVVGQQTLEVNDVFVKESTSDNWSEFIAEYSLDGLVNVISNKGSSCITLKLIKLANVNLWQRQHLLWWRSLLWKLLTHVHLLLLSHWILEHLVILLLSWLLTSRKGLLETHLLLLVAHYFVIAILLLLRHVLLLLLAVHVLARLVLTLVMATSTSASSASVIAAASASIVASAFILSLALVVRIASVVRCAIHSVVWRMHFALIHYKIDKLCETSMVFLLLLIFQIVL